MRSIKSTLLLLLGYLSTLFLLAQSPVTGEYFFDANTPYGDGTPFSLSSGETNFSIPTAALSAGVHRLYVRVLDPGGRWSQTQHYSVYVKHPRTIPIVRGEYFIDQTGVAGTGTPFDLPVSDHTDIDVMADLDVSEIAEGLHRLFYRFADANGQWSQLNNTAFWVKHRRVIPIVAGEYFIDVAGDFGTGTPLSFTAAGDSAVTTTIDLPDDLPDGQYTIFYRYQDADGKWSHLQHSTLCVAPSANPYLVTDQSELIVSPNPSRLGFVRLSLNRSLSEVAYVSLYDQLGRVQVANRPLRNWQSDSYQLFTEQLPPGVYLLTLAVGDERYRRRLVLQNN
ncbi:MAG: T9SS type A sorting domain-containing protein [Bacteroidota bacterium]